MNATRTHHGGVAATERDIPPAPRAAWELSQADIKERRMPGKAIIGRQQHHAVEQRGRHRKSAAARSRNGVRQRDPGGAARPAARSRSRMLRDRAGTELVATAT